MHVCVFEGGGGSGEHGYQQENTFYSKRTHSIVRDQPQTREHGERDASRRLHT